MIYCYGNIVIRNGYIYLKVNEYVLDFDSIYYFFMLFVNVFKKVLRIKFRKKYIFYS